MKKYSKEKYEQYLFCKKKWVQILKSGQLLDLSLVRQLPNDVQVLYYKIITRDHGDNVKAIFAYRLFLNRYYTDYLSRLHDNRRRYPYYKLSRVHRNRFILKRI